MKITRFLIRLGFVFSFYTSHSQMGEWTWMAGDSLPNQNNDIHAIYAAGSWTDNTGNFWIYGGVNANISLENCLYRFDIPTLKWINYGCGATPIYPALGKYTALAKPGGKGYGMFTWTDKRNHLWLYGGFGSCSSCLWQYDPVIQQWAWMGGDKQDANPNPVYGTKKVAGPLNTPGTRWESSTTWVDDSDNLWLFGGLAGYGIGGLILYNDMWKYDKATGWWAWMSGSKIPNNQGIYGPKDSASVNFYPAARMSNFSWKDNSGVFWLIGGASYDKEGGFSDVWKFNPVTLEWTLVKGSNNPDTASFSKTVCEPDTENVERAQYENRAVWKVCNDLIINCGRPYDSINYRQNDLWGYIPSKNEWVEIAAEPAMSNYGTKGVSSPLNYPPGRIGSVGFTDKDKNLWLFGGGDFSSSTRPDVYYNDMWKYTLDTLCPSIAGCTARCALAAPVISAGEDKICSGDSTRVCAPTGFASYRWHNSSSTSNCIYVSAASNYYVTVSDYNGCTAESNHLVLDLYPPTTVSINKKGDTLSSYNAVTYQWYRDGNLLQGDTSAVYIAHVPGVYTVVVTDTNGCTTRSTQTPVSIKNILADKVFIYPNPFGNKFRVLIPGELIGSVIEVFNDEGQLMYKSEINNEQFEISADFTSGVFILRLSSNKGTVIKKLIKL